MKIFLKILLLSLLSCSPNELKQENMEMIWVELHRPEVYNHFNAEKPGESWREFPVNEGPCKLIIKETTIQISTNKPIKKALHLTGKYGKNAKTMELLTRNSFIATITTPDEYGEVFRIFY